LWDQSADDLILTNAGLAVGSDATGDIYYRNSSGFLARLGASTDGYVLTTGGAGTAPAWESAPGSGSGDFSGPGSSTDNAVLKFDGTGGKTGQNSGIIIDDSNNITGAANVTLSGELDAATGDFSGIIDVAGAATLASLVCTAGGTFGGGYGSTGATISTAGVGQFNGALTTDGALTAASATFGDGDITNVGNIALDSISSDAGTSIAITLGTDAGDDLLVATNKLVVEGDSGNVGIGTDDPDAAAPTGSSSAKILKIDGGEGVDAAIQIVGHDNDHGLDLWTDVSTGDVYFDSRGDHANYDIRFRTKTTGTPVDAMTITGNGALSKASGSFKIDHPLPEKTDTHHLVHSFVEGPQADLIYRGTATLSSGTATVNIDAAARITDGTFVALNGNVQAFTTNESGWDAVRGSVSGNVLTITSSDSSSTATISWLVVGERKDAHMVSPDTRWTDSDGRVITEPSKEADPDRMTPARQAAEAEAESA